MDDKVEVTEEWTSGTCTITINGEEITVVNLLGMIPFVVLKELEND